MYTHLVINEARHINHTKMNSQNDWNSLVELALSPNVRWNYSVHIQN